VFGDAASFKLVPIDDLAEPANPVVQPAISAVGCPSRIRDGDIWPDTTEALESELRAVWDIAAVLLAAAKSSAIVACTSMPPWMKRTHYVSGRDVGKGLGQVLGDQKRTGKLVEPGLHLPVGRRRTQGCAGRRCHGLAVPQHGPDHRGCAPHDIVSPSRGGESREGSKQHGEKCRNVHFSGRFWMRNPVDLCCHSLSPAM
jgi:hypothetical protein